MLTDLESTNGTKVNGESIQLRILRVGVTPFPWAGRCSLFGSRDEIAERLARMRAGQADVEGNARSRDLRATATRICARFRAELGAMIPICKPRSMPLKPPDPPGTVDALAKQRSWRSLLEYIHIRMRNLISTAHPSENDEQIVLNFRRWQKSRGTSRARVAEYLRADRQSGRVDACCRGSGPHRHLGRHVHGMRGSGPQSKTSCSIRGRFCAIPGRGCVIQPVESIPDLRFARKIIVPQLAEELSTDNYSVPSFLVFFPSMRFSH